MFIETAKKYLVPGSSLVQSYVNFVKTKVGNPIAAYGSSDKSNPVGTPMALKVPKMRHARLSQDVSIFYTISGSNPSVLRVYALMSHSEAGTGQPPNKKKNASVASKMANQTFAP